MWRPTAASRMRQIPSRFGDLLSESGYAIQDSAEGADVVVMNTCAIREHAEQRVFGNLGALTHTKRRHPSRRFFSAAAWQGRSR